MWRNSLDLNGEANDTVAQDLPMQAYKIMHVLWGMGQMMFTN